jgi:ribosomal protein L7/L12
MSEPDPVEQANRIKAALSKGNKIYAIKLYREQTGVGLTEAKEAVEKLEAELRGSSPDGLKQSQAKGCSVGVLAVLVVIASLWRLFGA